MASDPHHGEAGSGGQTRRCFLQTLGVLGGALAGAGVASAAPTLSRAPVLKRSTAELSLKQPIALQKLTRSGPEVDVGLPTLPTLGEPALPSTRQRLLQTLFSDEGGLDPKQFELARGANGIWNLSAPLQVMSNDPLADAYGEGIMLTPTGCSFTPPMGLPPIGYASFQSVVTGDTFGQKLCLATVDHGFPGSFLGILLNTPGTPQTKLTYALELSMEPYDPRFECFIASHPEGAAYESAAVQFSGTMEGTYVALLELRGSGDVPGWAHTLSFRRGDASVGMTYFNWLNVIAV
jgi:hypothetical protein